MNSEVTSKDTITLSGWMAVFLSFAKNCSADLTVVGECRVRGLKCLVLDRAALEGHYRT